MKSLVMFAFLAVCATQVYSFHLPYPTHHLLGCPENHLSPYYNYPSVNTLPCQTHVPCQSCHGCQTCYKPKKSSELYPCPYRQHGPCECKH
uniref:Uncharacterized protein n=1 Tax=Anopheles coluzzii TaxID=1518534 RepID=A0A6E8VPX6_ANOCL